MRRITLLAIPFAAAAVFALSSPASASVTFDPATGTGFVGKGDVQLAFGWNNAVLQANAKGVAFSYQQSETYDAVCTWVTGEGTKGEKTHNVSHSTATALNSEVAYDVRTHKQVDGFLLKGFGATVETGTVPLVGGSCPGTEGHAGTWSAVTQTGTSGGLYVTSGETSVLLPPTVV